MERLCAVMTCSYGDIFGIEYGGDIMGVNTVNCESKYAVMVAGVICTDDVYVGYLLHLVKCEGCQFVFTAFKFSEAQFVYIVYRRMQTCRAARVDGASSANVAPHRLTVSIISPP